MKTKPDIMAEPGAWLTSADRVSYPTAPWHLRGRAFVSLWQVRASVLPADCVPQSVHPVTVLGRVFVGTAFAIYEPTGTLAYNEVMAAVQVLHRARPSLTVPLIWVDHPASIAGARAMWSIPKQEAAFQIGQGSGTENANFEASARTSQGEPIAELQFHSRVAMPGRWPVHTAIVQRALVGRGDRGLRVTEARVRARVSLGEAAWEFARHGPLGFLRGRKPLVSVRLTDMSLQFGSS